MTLYYKRSQTELTALFCTGSTQHITAPCDFIYLIFFIVYVHTPIQSTAISHIIYTQVHAQWLFSTVGFTSCNAEKRSDRFIVFLDDGEN